ncbi:N-acetylmuramoyl-L-alanine amidase [Oceanobacillus sp. FSL W8-0428]|uniref:N-acetylmuramoyl-L-alanine amidase n=1 Tax=Oceanobacillus sp. FSL W8-0428 TaxID=2921715 RepID=UPI0030FA0149
MAKVAMCAGHGGSGSTPGKRSPAGEYEWNFNDAVVRAAIAKLKANGVEVLRTDDASGKTDIGLTARTNKANAWGADVYVSCHHNALGTSWLNYEIGIETFTQNGSHPQAEILARCIHPKYVKAMGLKDRGMKKSNLAITRQTKMPAVLTEGGFMDSRIDIKSMRDNAKLKAQGEAIADGIMEFLNVKNTNSAPKVSKPSSGKTGSKQITKPKSILSVDGKWGNSTTQALQEALNTPVDGVISKQPKNAVTQALYSTTVQFGNGSSNVIVALQKKVGVKADGKLGPATIKALQKYLGTPQDGVLSRPSMVVEEMQRRLNAGTF